MTIRDRLRCRSIASTLRSRTRAYALAQLAEQARQIDPTATWSRPMNFTLRPQRPRPDPAIVNGPEEIVVDGQVIGRLTAYQYGDGPRMFTASIDAQPWSVAVYERDPVVGSDLTPETAIAKAIARGIEDKARALATLRALEARLEAVTA